MADQNVGWLVPQAQPAAGKTGNMNDFETKLDAAYHADTGDHVIFPPAARQFLGGDNANLYGCVQALLTFNAPRLDAFAVAGSTGVGALAGAPTWLANPSPIIQVVGGDPVPNNTYITGYHINAHKVGFDQVDKIHGKWAATITQITVLMDYTSNTAAEAFNGIVMGVKNLNATYGLTVQVRKPVLVSTPAEVHALRAANPVVGCLMLTPSGMFYDTAVKQDIVWLVENANAKAIYPEHEFRDEHSPVYKNNTRVWGHHINKTYNRVDLANALLKGLPTPGQEAPDMDNVP
jgi:hypothetical protein